MGRTNKPLNLEVDQSIYEQAPDLFDELRAKGHAIQIRNMNGIDVILGPQCFRLTRDMIEYLKGQSLDLAMKGARALRYGTFTQYRGKKGRS
jgi:hypothetical protein